MRDQEFQSIDEADNQDILYSRDISEQIELELSSFQQGKWWMHLINGIHLMFMLFALVGSWITFSLNCSKSFVVLIILMILSIFLSLYNIVDSKLQRKRQIYIIICLCSAAQIIFLIAFIFALSQNIYCQNAICHPQFNGRWFKNSSNLPSKTLTDSCNNMQKTYSDNYLQLSFAIQEYVQATANQYCLNQQNQNPPNDDDSNSCDTLKHFQIEVTLSSTFYFGAIMISAYVLCYIIMLIYVIRKMKQLEVKRGQSFERGISESSQIPYNNYY